MAQKHKIVIIGAGFGGITMAKYLKKKEYRHTPDRSKQLS